MRVQYETVITIAYFCKMVPDVFSTPISGLALIKPAVFTDSRGYFTETYNYKDFCGIGITDTFVQDNQSLSQKGALRGLHFQKPPFAQAKLVRVISGSVLDVVVDIRPGSDTYGQNYSVILNADNYLQLYIPQGFAHGFLTLEDQTIFAYKCSDYYNKGSEEGLIWNDPDLNISWGTDNPFLSDKDKTLQGFRDFRSPF
jgi:dTDP-4-dehydrorhamnose 3,5-epimerase